MDRLARFLEQGLTLGRVAQKMNKSVGYIEDLFASMRDELGWQAK